MAILTYIDGIPLYSTINEALGLEKGILKNVTGVSGYHVHRYKNVIGYMTGADHSQSYTINTPPQQQQQPIEQVRSENTYSGSQNTEQTTEPTGLTQPSTGSFVSEETGRGGYE